MGKKVQNFNEQKYQAFFENTLAVLFITKPDGTILEANPAAVKIFGYTVEEFRKVGRLGVLDPDSPGLKEMLKEREEQGYTKGELIAIRKDGTRFPTEISSSIFYDESGERFTSTVMIDITDRKLAEQRIIDSERQYAITLDSVGDYIFNISVKEDETYKISYANEQFLNVVGLKREEVIGLDLKEVLPKDSLLIQKKKYREAIKKRERVIWEESVTARIGKRTGIVIITPIFDHQGNCVQFICSINDITDRKIRDLQKNLAADIHAFFNQSEQISDALKLTLDSIMRLDYFIMAEVWMVNNERRRIDLTSHVIPNDKIKSFYERTQSKQSFKYGEGLPGQTWKLEKELFWKELGMRKKFLRSDEAKKAGIKVVFSFPIMDEGVVSGVLILGLKSDISTDHYIPTIFRELVVSLGTEISRKKLEDELSLIFESAPDIICVAGLDGYFRKVNPAMSQLLGYSEEELLTKPIVDFTHPEDREKTEAELEALRREEGNRTFENRYITKAGKIIWLSWTTKPIYNQGITFSVAKNVTEQRETEELFRMANRLARIGSWEVDLIDEEIYWSDITRKIHEVNSDYEPNLNEAINFYREGEHREVLTKAFEEAVEKGTPYDLELQIVTAKGNIKWVRTIGEAEFVDGNCVRVYGSFQDIHEDKELRQFLEQQTKELAASNADLEQFAFVASHDLQEPLRMITSFLAQLENKYEDLLDERGKKYIYFATDGARRMRQIILDLLDYSRVGRINIEKEEVDLNEILNNVISLQSKLINEKGAKVTRNHLPLLYATRTPIQLLLQNLINNALNYQYPDNKPIINVSSEDIGSHWTISVSDNGIGINPEHHDKIFNLFQRLHGKDVYGGTGLGLAISKKIVEEHGGKIWVESEEGKGSTFYFTIEKKRSGK